MDFPDPGIKPGSSTLQADASPSELPRKSNNHDKIKSHIHKLERNTTKEILTLLEGPESHIKLPSLEVQHND